MSIRRYHLRGSMSWVAGCLGQGWEGLRLVAAILGELDRCSITDDRAVLTMARQTNQYGALYSPCFVHKASGHC